MSMKCDQRKHMFLQVVAVLGVGVVIYLLTGGAVIWGRGDIYLLVWSVVIYKFRDYFYNILWGLSFIY